MPFARAVEVFADFTGVKATKIVAMNSTETAEAAYVQMQEEVGAWEQGKSQEVRTGADKMQVSADGATPHLRWVQVWFPYATGSGQKYAHWWWEKYRPT